MDFKEKMLECLKSRGEGKIFEPKYLNEKSRISSSHENLLNMLVNDFYAVGSLIFDSSRRYNVFEPTN